MSAGRKSMAPVGRKSMAVSAEVRSRKSLKEDTTEDAPARSENSNFVDLPRYRFQQEKKTPLFSSWLGETNRQEAKETRYYSELSFLSGAGDRLDGDYVT